MEQHHILTTFAAAATLGVFLLILAGRLKISAIVILLLGGILAGPQGLGLVHPEYLGAGLHTIISLAVGLILFEGGLTLDLKGYQQSSREIHGILTKGVLVTWLTSAVVIKLVFGFEWAFCIAAASLIIVTGPTVIGPLLRRIRVRENLHHILHWEGVLIDPIGVFIALLCFEYTLAINAGDSQAHVLLDFLARFAVGAIVGGICGQVLYYILKRDWVPEEYLNIFVLASAILSFTLADIVIPESGLLSVTIAGLLVGYRDTPKLDKIIAYKVELKDFLIGLLFVLLAANLDLTSFSRYGMGLVIVVAAVMFVVRPLNVFISTRNSSLEIKEKLFLSWIAPRGIVAASMASVFAIKLGSNENAPFLETFTYSVIAGTVIFQGFTAKWVGKLLGVLEPKPSGWVIVGAHSMGRALASFLKDQGVSVNLVDSNAREVQLANREGLSAICENAMAMDPEHYEVFYGCGNFLALTPNEDLNRLLCQRWYKLLNEARVYRWEKEALEEDNRLDVGLGLWHQHGLEASMGAGDEAPPLKVVEGIPGKIRKPERVLMTVIDRKNVVTGCPVDIEDTVTMLMLGEAHENKGELELPVREEWVIFSEDENLEQLYRQMLELTRDAAPELDRAALLSDLLAREAEFTSLLGHGISLPHAYSKVVSDTLLLVGRATRGIPCMHTGTEINLVFMLLSPEDEPTLHLERISRIARLIGKEEDRETLLNANSAQELYEVIAAA